MLFCSYKNDFEENLNPVKKQYYLYLLIATVTAVLLAGKIQYTLPQFEEIDLFKYREMALAAPGVNMEIPHPYVYRIFAPWLAGILPFDLDTSFYVLNLLFLFGLSYVIFEFILLFGLEYKTAFFATVAFLFNRYFFQFLAFDYFQLSDTLSYFLFVLSFILLTKRQYFRFGLSVAIGVLTREVALLIIPIGFAYLYENKWGKEDYIKFLAVSAIAALLFLAVRMFIQIESDENYLTQIEYGLVNFFNPRAFLKRFIIAFTPFSVLPFLFYKELIKLLRENKYLIVWIVFAVASSLFGNDYERLMMPTAPVFFLFLALLIEKYFISYKNGFIQKVLLFLVIILSLVGSLYHLWGVFRLANPEISLISTIILDILILLIFGYLKIFRERTA